MQLPDSQHLIDCISAKQLLQALNTLQQMNEPANNQLQLSFSQSSQSYFNTANNQNNINFELYMAIKNNRKKGGKEPKGNALKEVKNNNNKSMSNINKSGVKINKKENLTPNKDKSFNLNRSINKSTLTVSKNKSIEVKHEKSRSHSPLPNRISDVGRVSYPAIPFNSGLKARKNKENQPQIHEQTAASSVRICYNSKKILLEKQKKGVHYVPIQNRTNQLLKQKQQKIAKLQKINLTQRELEDKECTFRPSINSYKKFLKNKQEAGIKNRHRNHTVYDSISEDHELSQINQYHEGKTEQLFKQEPVKQKMDNQKSFRKETNPKLTPLTSKNEQPKKKQKQKPKNSKFNILLDLID